MASEDPLEEQLKTIRNLCDAGMIVHGLCRDDLVPTILEELYWEVQNLIDDYCIKQEE